MKRGLVTATTVISLLIAESHGQFVPNDPYFLPGITAAIPTADYYGQWHLRNLAPQSVLNSGLDANLWGAWQRGLTGRDVVISIVDDGLEGDHPDLAPAFQNDFSWDFSLTAEENNASLLRGAPRLTENHHGTAVAGVAAARGANGIGITGAAPFASIASLRFLAPIFAETDSVAQSEAWAIGFQGQKNEALEFDPKVPFLGSTAPVRVMNHSYAYREAYYLEEMSHILFPALAASAARNVIHVYIAGNSRGEWTTQDSNTLLTNTSPNVIVVAAMGSNGRHASYSSFGANVLVTAPSNSQVPPELFGIVTTDRVGAPGYNATANGTDRFFAPNQTADFGNYTSTFGGTSSAAPLVSGIMALGIEANPEMDVRMARHLIARTSRRVDPGDPAWTTNAAGYAFNKNYGFGLIDADAFTFAATQVVNVSDLTIFREPEQILVGEAFSPTKLTLTQSYVVGETVALPIEYVQVRLRLSGLQVNPTDYAQGAGATIGDLSATLRSPGGTTYGLFFQDRNLIAEENEFGRAMPASIDWTYTSYAYFGESHTGAWQISIQNASPNLNDESFGRWDSFQLTFGTGTILLIPEPASYLLLVVALGFLASPVMRKYARRT